MLDCYILSEIRKQNVQNQRVLTIKLAKSNSHAFLYIGWELYLFLLVSIFLFYNLNFSGVLNISTYVCLCKVTRYGDDFTIKSKYHHFTFCLVSYIT